MPQEKAILLCVRTLGSGGTERQAAALALGLHRQGYRVHVNCSEAGGFRAEELQTAGIPIFVNEVRGLYKPGTLLAARKLVAYLRQHNIGLVHTFDFPMNIFAAPVARWAGVKVFTSQRCFRDTIPAKYHRLLRWAHRCAHLVVTNSKGVQDHLVSDYGISRNKSEVCYNGLDLTTFHARGRTPEETLTIGTVSVLRSEKGLGDLLRAVALLPSRDWQLILVGDGPERAGLISSAQQLGITGQCRFVSDVQDVAGWLRRMDIFVLPSHSEALSNSLMEAMACGCVAAASNVGGNPELITHGETGVLFPSRDPATLAVELERLIQQPELRHRLSAAAAETMAKGFSLDSAVQRMAALYKTFGIAEPQRS